MIEDSTVIALVSRKLYSITFQRKRVIIVFILKEYRKYTFWGKEKIMIKSKGSWKKARVWNV